MTAKYHISPKTGKAAPCSATVRACRYSSGVHYNTLAEAQQAADARTLTTVISKALNTSKPAVVVPGNPLVENTKASVLYSGVDYEYDYYGHADGQECDAVDDYCRDQVYEGLRVGSVSDYRNVLSTVFKIDKPRIPQDLDDLAIQLGMDTPEAYEARAEGGYYGEEAEVYLADHVQAELKKWYYNHNNARDRDGVLDYCRSKGLDTTDKSPLQAIKDQLKEENNGIIHPDVEKATDIMVHNVETRMIKIPNAKHFDSVEPRSANKKTTKGKKIAGVLAVKNNELVLIDGYHRMKDAKKNGRKQGDYIILNDSGYWPYWLRRY